MKAIDIITWVPRGIFLFFGGMVTLSNWIGIAEWYLYQKHSSTGPLVGGVLAAIGVALMPVKAAHYLWWIPLFIDPGCAILLVFELVFLFRWYRGK